MYTGSLAPASNREDLIITSPLIDDDGAEVDLTNADLYFFICKSGCPNDVLIRGEYVDGISDGKMTLVNENLAWQVQFAPEEMGKLCAGTYDVFMRCEIAGITTQVIAATIAILEGGPNG